MKKLLILGAGSGGTMMSNHLRKKLKKDEWEISIVDKDKVHYYQPGYIFLPFGMYTEEEIMKPKKKFIKNKRVNYIDAEIDLVKPKENTVLLKDGTVLTYDVLIISTGSEPVPAETEGMLGKLWYKDIFDFYTFEGAKALKHKLESWEGGNMVVHITEMPIKCPVAPLELSFLANDFFKKKGMRDKVKITYVTPVSGAFTKPKAADALGHLLEEKGVNIVADFAIEKVDNERKMIVDYGGKEVPFDLLVTVPTNMGAEFVERSGMGDDLRFIPTDKNTLQSKAHENIFVIGDAADLPTSKAGSVAHFEAEVLTENIMSFVNGEELKARFDGHANCFIETGGGKALLIDFNYNQEPVAGTFPFNKLGPMNLLKESKLNHWGKLAFKQIYWKMILKARPIPFITTDMTLKGKKVDEK
ncbi:MAG: NAD(P)/FAD-dependent oxidoreductase [Bacteroidetes bacterium]|nr:NAD(P)/FAD-dependent oxidoreductase [Bacteroidota bacterium]